MAPPSTIRKALGAVKDQTSISIAKVSSNIDPDLDVAVVKATSHSSDPADERHIREILALTHQSRPLVSACVAAVSRRLAATRDWIVAIKSLALAHRLLADGDAAFRHEFLLASRHGGGPHHGFLHVSDFRDEAHSRSWDHSAFVRAFAGYIDHRLDCPLYEQKTPPRHYDDDERRSPAAAVTTVKEMKTEVILDRMRQFQRLLDRFLECRPTGSAKSSRLVLVTLYPVLREGFQLYENIREILAVLLDRFFEMEHYECVKAFEAYSTAAQQIDELARFWGWCKDVGVARSSEFPEVERIMEKVLETMEEFVRDRARRPKSPEKPHEESAGDNGAATEEEDMNSIKALPAPEGYEEQKAAVQKQQPPEQKKKEETADLVNLRDDEVSVAEQADRLALTLFSTGTASSNANGAWEAFPSDAPGQPVVTSAWQTPAAEKDKADWELVLVETASNLSKQKAALAGGFDPLLLNGMYDAGAVRQHVNASQMSGGSASSVALPGAGQKSNPVLALPAPDGTVQAVGQDPFVASLSVPPPSYVQMADMEKKQQFVVQEQQVWQQYAREGMQGQVSLAKLDNGYGQVPMPYGLPPINGGYYYAPQAVPYGMPPI